MAFLVSPGVQVNEVDLTNVVPAVATSIGAIAGAIQKGPVSSVVNISSEEELVEIFGKPVTTGNQFETFFSAANFLKYGNSFSRLEENGDILQNVVCGYSTIPFNDSGATVSNIIGWAYDGNPIYGPFGFVDPEKKSTDTK